MIMRINSIWIFCHQQRLLVLHDAKLCRCMTSLSQTIGSAKLATDYTSVASFDKNTSMADTGVAQDVTSLITECPGTLALHQT